MRGLVRLDRAREIKRAKKRIKELLKEGLVAYSEHALGRLQKRGLDMNDIRCVIRWGSVTRGGTNSFPGTPRRYMLEGRGVDGSWLVYIVDINGALVLVTAWPK
jgi:hypothetical protein